MFSKCSIVSSLPHLQSISQPPPPQRQKLNPTGQTRPKSQLQWGRLGVGISAPVRRTIIIIEETKTVRQMSDLQVKRQAPLQTGKGLSANYKLAHMIKQNSGGISCTTSYEDT